MEFARALAKILFNRLGYDVRRAPYSGSSHVAAEGADPVTYEYDPAKRGHVMFDVSLDDVRGLDPICFALNGRGHPFTAAFRAALVASEGERLATIEQQLRAYYEAVEPECALDVVDLRASRAPGLAGVEPAFYKLPWTAKSAEEIRIRRRRTAIVEGMQNGVAADVSHGLTNFGPATDRKIALETSRIARLSKSFAAKGFVPFQKGNPLQVGGLRSNGKYRWAVTHGQHRFALAAAASIATVPAQIVLLVRREDASYWPGVLDGTYTEAGALEYFDRIFEGRPARIAEPWLARQGCAFDDI